MVQKKIGVLLFVSIGGVAGAIAFGPYGDPSAPWGQDNGKQRSSTGKPDVDNAAEAGALFQKNCLGCHQPPDVTFATDRAWIDQLNRTA